MSTRAVVLAIALSAITLAPATAERAADATSTTINVTVVPDERVDKTVGGGGALRVPRKGMPQGSETQRTIAAPPSQEDVLRELCKASSAAGVTLQDFNGRRPMGDYCKAARSTRVTWLSQRRSSAAVESACLL